MESTLPVMEHLVCSETFSYLRQKVPGNLFGGFDKFSLNNSVDLVLRRLKTDVLCVIFEKCVKEPPPLLVKNAFILLQQAQTAKVLPQKIEKPFNQKQELLNSLVVWFHLLVKGHSFSQISQILFGKLASQQSSSQVMDSGIRSQQNSWS